MTLRNEGGGLRHFMTPGQKASGTSAWQRCEVGLKIAFICMTSLLGLNDVYSVFYMFKKY